MYSIEQVSDWFLWKESMTPKKLQKLCYYAEAWSQALYNEDLINDTEFEAWAHGPVSPILYRSYNDFGWNEIPKNDGSNIEIQESKVNDLLEAVWATYGDKSANELEALTHIEMPWKIARGDLSEGDRSNAKIDKKIMRHFYRSIYVGD